MQENRLKSIKNNIKIIKKNILEASARAGRDAGEIRLMAVTKGQPLEAVETAIRAGLKLFGENRVQEALGKYTDIHDEIELHLIGHLQRNKAKKAAQLFQCVQSIDKSETAVELNKYSKAEKKVMDILIEVNTSGEGTKFGIIQKDTLLRLTEEISGLKNLKIRGLMTIGPFTNDTKRIHKAFAGLRSLFLEIKTSYNDNDFNILSMGMSADYRIAITEGSNLLRIGTALFGQRGY